MHGVFFTIWWGVVLSAIMMAGTEALLLILAGLAALTTPEIRNWTSFKIVLVAGLMVGGGLDVLLAAYGTWFALGTHSAYSAPTFIGLGVLFTGLTVWAWRKLNRLMKIGPAEPPRGGSTLRRPSATVVEYPTKQPDDRSEAA